MKSTPPPKKKKKNQDQCYAYCHPVFCFAPTTMPTNFPEQKKHLEDPDVKKQYPEWGPANSHFPAYSICLVRGHHEPYTKPPSFWGFGKAQRWHLVVKSIFDHGVFSLYFMHCISIPSLKLIISTKIEDWQIMCFPVWRGFLVGTMVVSGKASKQNGCLGVLDLGPQKSQQKLLPT